MSVPGTDDTSVDAAARSRVAVERDGWIWVWGADPESADASLIPDHHWTASAEWTSVGGTERIRARSSLLIDNFLDLTHETFVHTATLGSQAIIEQPLRARADGRVVHAERQMYGCDAPPLYQEMCGLVSPIDRSQEIEFHVPSLFLLRVRLRPAGTSDEMAMNQRILYAITPETATSTVELWAVCRDFGRDDQSLSAAIERGLHSVIDEDRRALEAQEACYDTPFGATERREANVAADAAALHARRITRTLAEASTSAPDR